MVLIKKIHNRGSTIVVEAHGEILFAATGPVGRWTKELTEAIEIATQGNAPKGGHSKGRPRWAHYGKPLSQTFDSSVSYQPSRMKVYGAVGASAKHAAFVDQGTGVFAGNGAIEVKMLPPWRRGSPSLYERKWSLLGPSIKPVFSQGQPGQFFFDKGLKQGFAAMRILSFEAPMSPKIADAVRTLPESLLRILDQSDNTTANPVFKAQLDEWRAWRYEAFNEGRKLGFPKGRKNSRPGRKYVKKPKRQRSARDIEYSRQKNRERQQRFRDKKRAIKTSSQRTSAETIARAETRVSQGLRQRGYSVRELVLRSNGTWTARVRGRRDTGYRTVEGTW